MDPFIAQIMMFGGNFAPRGWAFCDGQLLSIAQHTALFSLLGTTYGGDGRTTFGLPDLRGRVPVHPGHGPGLTPRHLGERSGAETNTLTTTQMPTHFHTINAGGASGSTANLKATEGAGNTASPASAKSVASQIVIGRDTYNILSSNDPTTKVVGAVTDISAGGVPTQTDNAGGGQAINNMQPYTCVNFIIALEGIYPSRG